jgi:hypothetical protein
MEHRESRDGGRGGIRTHGGLSPTAVFKTAALNHSATRPGFEPAERVSLAASPGVGEGAHMDKTV